MKNLFLYSLLLFFAALAGCQEEKNGDGILDPSTESEDSIPAFVFHNVDKWYSEDATMKVKMQAPLEVVYQKNNVISTIVFPKGVKISMYDEYGVRETTLTADTGRHFANTKIFSASGNVEVINYKERQRVNTPVLNWNQRKKEIYTDEIIKITTPYEVLEGVGMTSNEEFSKYKIWKPVGTFVLRTGEKVIPLDSSQVGRRQRSVMQNSRTMDQLRQQQLQNKKPLDKKDPKVQDFFERHKARKEALKKRQERLNAAKEYQKRKQDAKKKN